MTPIKSRRQLLVVFGLLILVAASCSSGDDSEDSGTDSTANSDQTTSTLKDTNVPVGPALVDGLPIVEVLGPAESGAGEAPQFRWESITGAAKYSLAVRGPDGPLWGWQGEETEIYLGGLPFERPPGWAGPVIVAGTCWSVMARDAEGHVIAVSQLLPVSPAASTGHTCVPGEGEEPGA